MTIITDITQHYVSPRPLRYLQWALSTQAMPRTLLGINGDQQSSLIGQSWKSSLLIGWKFVQSVHYEVGRVRTTVMPASTASLVPQTECVMEFFGLPIYLYPIADKIGLFSETNEKPVIHIWRLMPSRLDWFIHSFIWRMVFSLNWRIWRCQGE